MTTNATTRTPILAALLAAHHTAAPAREALAEVPWAEIPELLTALGVPLAPNDAAVVAAGIAETDAPRGRIDARRIVAIRHLLAIAGDSARRAVTHGGRTHATIAAAAELCSELVGLTAEALSLLDTASRVAA